MSASQHVTDLVDDFVHDLLGPREAADVDLHCASCPACARALEQAKRRLNLMQSVPPVEPAADLVPRTMQRVEGREDGKRLLKKRFTLASLSGLAAAVLLLFGCHWYYANLKPPTHDLVMLGQGDLFAGSNASVRIRVVDRATQRNVANVPVRLAMRSPQGQDVVLAEFVTDDQGAGSPRFEVPDWANGSYPLTITGKTPGGTESVRRNVTLKRSMKLMLSSDKPVYQPGQTIQLRSLALRRPDLKPVSEQNAVFTLIDPKGNVLFKHTQPTSKFGISSASCELASEIQEGAYAINCQVGDTNSRMAIEIKRYVLPKFKLVVTPNRPYYRPGESGKLVVQADYFFGKPVANGTVEVKITSPGAKVKEVATLKGETDAKGKVELNFTIPRSLVGTEKNAGDATLDFAVSVADTAEQKQEIRTSRLVTETKAKLVVLPESGRLVKGVPNVVHLLVTLPDGQPLSGARVEANGDDLNADVRTDTTGTASFTFTPTKDDVSWTMRVSLGDDVLLRRNDQMKCGSNAFDFLVRTDRAAYRSGQSMTLTAFGAGVEPVFVDFIKDGQTLASETVELKSGKGEHTFDIPADLFGTVELVAYRFGVKGLAARKRRVVYISPTDALKINATLDKGEYRPGRTANLNLALTDFNGKPTPGAISLVAVDEAVFHVLSQKPGMEQAFYTLEEELLKPVYAIYPWMPGEEKNANRDQAIFATTSQPMPEGGISSTFRNSRSGDGREIMREENAGEPVASAPERHTLSVNSLPESTQKLEQLRHERLEQVRLGWMLTILAAVLLAYSSLWVYLPFGQVLMLHGIGAIVLMGLFVLGTAFLTLGTDAKNTFSSVGQKIGGMAPSLEKSKSAAKRDSGGSPQPMAPGDRDFFRSDTPSKSSPAKYGSPTPGKEDFLASEAPRVRNYFPETLLWKPELITDDNGKLPPLPIELADSITTWRMTASAVSGDGRLGALQMPMKVFQPFFVDLNLPVSLTRNDEVGMPVVVYNYLSRPQSVKLTLSAGSWFTLTGNAEQTIDLGPGEVKSTRYSIKVNTVGVHKLKVTALAGEVGDAIEREIEVIPDGRRVEVAHSGTLDKTMSHSLNVPADAIEGSVKAFVKVYPSSFSQLVEGLDNIFRMPSGCFEQTSSTTYPNILALEYLRRTNQKSPKIEAKARQYIHLGYQRLVGFEVQGGGFDWYGKPPAHQTLTAYGLMEFVDMAKVHDVDPNLIDRTRNWLLSKRKADGSWDSDQRFLRAGQGDDKTARLAATAYIAWAVFADGQSKSESQRTLDFLLAHSAKEIGSDYLLALVCNALAAIDPKGKDTADYLTELLRRRKKSDDGKLAWWEPNASERMIFYGGGEPAKIETTALAALALLSSESQAVNARPSLAWLVTKKDAQGTWFSTQATVLSLKALVTGTGKPTGDGERRIEVKAGDKTQTIRIPADQAEVMKLVDISSWLKSGDNTLSLAELSKTAPGYQVVFRYHVPEAKGEKAKEPLKIDIAYDRDTLSVGESVKATAAVTNQMGSVAPMVMLDLPIPPGFAPDSGDFTKLVEAGKIAKFTVQARRVLVYLRALEADKPLVLSYSLQATMPVKATADAARVYEYYDPHKQGTTPAKVFTVKAK